MEVGPGVTDVALGDEHTCAILGDRTVQCWGDGGAGELGTGESVTGSNTPVIAMGAIDIQQLVAGDEHTCAASDSAVYCWGGNGFGQLGLGDTVERLAPASTPFPGSLDLATSANHTCAIDASSGIVSCWGNDAFLQLGRTMTPIDPTMPGEGPSLAVSHVATGESHTCVRTDTGEIHCWGANDSGQMGNGDQNTMSNPPERSMLAVAATDVESFANSTCALLSGGSVSCWGQNVWGELGNGTRDQQRTPVPVTDLTNVTQIAMGEDHACALDGDGAVWCWGSDNVGQLGLGTRRYVPGEVLGL